MSKKGRKQDGRSTDLAFHWLCKTHGEQWRRWQELLADYFDEEREDAITAARHDRRAAITGFLERFLIAMNYPTNPETVLRADFPVAEFSLVMEKFWKSNHSRSKLNNYVHDFLQWVLLTRFSVDNDQGKAVVIESYRNPVKRLGQAGSDNDETVRNALPYRYLSELRNILCPVDSQGYSDWKWAQENISSDWFEVDPEYLKQLNKNYLNDPDCVVRQRTVTRDKKKATITELWSPVRAMALLVKLHLPLRTFQVRMLDSGEADSWKLEAGTKYQGIDGQWHHDTGVWVKNDSTLVQHPARTADARGVFRRKKDKHLADYLTGFYINTNKTADNKKDTLQKGYTIPWQHTELLFWLTKLRDWQAKYNPISEPVSWLTLEKRHTGTNRSKVQLEKMGSNAFLFRNAAWASRQKGQAHKQAAERAKPIIINAVNNAWTALLHALEKRVSARGETLTNGEKLTFNSADYPLHSLRVSLLTCYAMEGGVPFPVLGKLLAGHSRLLMTLYYTKAGIGRTTELLNESEKLIRSKESAAFKTWLKNASYEQIEQRVAYSSKEGVRAALASRNPIGWEERHIGLCLMGGNTSQNEENAQVGGCWNGGALLKPNATNPSQSVYGSVPNGPENCVRCRWFITEDRFVDALRAHWNTISYRATLAADLAVEHEQAKQSLEDERWACEQSGMPWTKAADLQQAERRYEKQMAKANELANDLHACLRLIARIVSIEENRDAGDSKQKMIANGSFTDVQTAIQLVETDSLPWQLCEISEDAEYYSDEADELRKTPAILDRSQFLNSALMRDGLAPVFMLMDERMQLIAGNAMVRAMARKANPKNLSEGRRQVAGLVEAGESLMIEGLLPSGVKALEDLTGQSVLQLNQLLNINHQAADPIRLQ